MKGRPIRWTPEELAFLAERRAAPRRETYAEFVRRFGRAGVSFSAMNGLCKRMGWLTGRDGRFRAGAAPRNKGVPGSCGSGGEATRFRKGNLPHNTKFLGHERVTQDGYIEISVAERNPRTGFERRYVLKHLWAWESVNGALPPGMCLKCLDGDRANCDPANWRAIPRAMLPRLGGRYGRGYDDAPPELRPAIMAVAQLEHAIRARTRPQKPPRPRGRPPSRPVLMQGGHSDG